MMLRRFRQVDVFTDVALQGNPLAVVLDGDGLDEATMAAFARWTNLSETTFLLPPTQAGADYRLRIFTPGGELPFAGHPTLGSCRVWLDAGGQPQRDTVVQECGVGLVTIRRDGARLAFAAPPLRRHGPAEPALAARIAAALGLAPAELEAVEWVDNGPGWVAALLSGRDRLLALQPDLAALEGVKLGLVAPWPGGEAAIEVRAFVGGRSGYEDPVTGSLNASLAQWLIGSGRLPPRYEARQGSALGRRGRVHLARGEDGRVWVGGDVSACIDGRVAL
ncbi:PhzF family phenazine biosynthesis protein [Piscinibacter sakaiensis]|uniref:Phenazine biosynthesis protein PhzF like n=1 Tax=Piscinibacter sakaiensis TaxID=1547922 RepID=A0A0K8P0A1_PISS1|nr:PhzF family phenazine biosynthesis protein [Piscinibacter sakaiensis]GAP36061.1 phenazine biosynthesis protein PhzF like [Piscinibacter sakaiensis]